MACSDFVADFITIIRNAARAHKEKLTAPSSVLTEGIAEILKEEGFVDSVKKFQEGPKRFVRVHLKYVKGDRAAIQGIKRISKPGRRAYVGVEDIQKVQGGLGVAILSTSKGVMTDRNARKEKIGGEVLCSVW